MDSLTSKLDLNPNQAVCFNCGKVLTSKHQYDMVVCACGAMAIDGGYSLRIIELIENPARTRSLSPTDDIGFSLIF